MTKSSKVFFIFLILSSIFFAPHAQAKTATLENAGFMPGKIWFSKQYFYAGSPVRIYTVIFNGSDINISGTANFYNNRSLIGKSEFSIDRGKGVKEVWLDWIASKGSNRIKVVITDIMNEDTKEKLDINSPTLAEARTEEFFTDAMPIDPLIKDTDGDGTPDEQELRYGTDMNKPDSFVPLVPASTPLSILRIINPTAQALNSVRNREIETLKNFLSNTRKEKIPENGTLSASIKRPITIAAASTALTVLSDKWILGALALFCLVALISRKIF
jgi:hypothetical protein